MLALQVVSPSSFLKIRRVRSDKKALKALITLTASIELQLRVIRVTKAFRTFISSVSFGLWALRVGKRYLFPQSASCFSLLFIKIIRVTKGTKAIKRLEL